MNPRRAGPGTQWTHLKNKGNVIALQFPVYKEKDAGRQTHNHQKECGAPWRWDGNNGAGKIHDFFFLDPSL